MMYRKNNLLVTAGIFFSVNILIQIIFVAGSVVGSYETTMVNQRGFKDDFSYLSHLLVEQRVSSDVVINSLMWELSSVATRLGGERHTEKILRFLLIVFLSFGQSYAFVLMRQSSANTHPAIIVGITVLLSFVGIVISKEPIVICVMTASVYYSRRIMVRGQLRATDIIVCSALCLLMYATRYTYVPVIMVVYGVSIVISTARKSVKVVSVSSYCVVLVLVAVWYMNANSDLVSELFVDRYYEMISEGNNYSLNAATTSLSYLYRECIMFKLAKLLAYPSPTDNWYLYLFYLPIVYVMLAMLVALPALRSRKTISNHYWAELVAGIMVLMIVMVIGFEENPRYKLSGVIMLIIGLTNSGIMTQRRTKTIVAGAYIAISLTGILTYLYST